MSPQRGEDHARLGELIVLTGEGVSAAEFTGKRNFPGQGASWDFDGLFPARMSRWSFVVGKEPAFLDKREKELL